MPQGRMWYVVGGMWGGNSLPTTCPYVAGSRWYVGGGFSPPATYQLPSFPTYHLPHTNYRIFSNIPAFNA
jgi:hypothetical protein